MRVKNYNEKVLEQLEKQMPEQWEKAWKKFPKIKQWEKKESLPTYKQLAECAKIFRIPFGYFFLEKLPEQKLPIRHYRTATVKNMPEFHPSLELLETIEYVELLQEWAKEILIEWGQTPLPFVGKYNTNSNINEIISELRTILQLQNDWANDIPTWNDTFSFLIERAENAGVFIVINGVVGNNTHRKLDVDEFRGFVLCDKIAPFIFINNQDALSAKIFTLIHELVHLLIGESASFDLRNLQSAENKIEKFCDKCTAEFLVPTSQIEQVKEVDFEKLAKKFKVSQLVIARRLLDVNKINKEQFFNFYNDYIQQEYKKLKSGGDFYKTVIRRYGRKFLQILSIAVETGSILYRDAYQLMHLDPSKFDYIKKEVLPN